MTTFWKIPRTIPDRVSLISIAFSVIVGVASIVGVAPYFFSQYEFELEFDTGVHEKSLGYYRTSGDWAGLPAYPDFSSSSRPMKKPPGLGFFVISAFSDEFVGTDVPGFSDTFFPLLLDLCQYQPVSCQESVLVNPFSLGLPQAIWLSSHVFRFGPNLNRLTDMSLPSSTLVVSGGFVA